MLKELKQVLLDDFWIMPATPRYTSAGIPYITSKNIKNGKIDFENINYINVEDYKKISKKRPILVNDILISMIGTLGEIAIVQDSDGIFYGQNMFLIRLNTNKINQRYFVNYFKSDVAQRQLINKQNKSTQSYLKANHIESLRIPIPDLEEQKKIAYKLDKINEIIDMRKKQIEDLNELIKSQFVEMFKDKDFEKKGIRELVNRNIIKAKKKFLNGEKIKYIDISSIDNTKNQVIGFNEFEIGKEPSRAQQCLEKNDILISTVRPNLKNVAVNRYEDDNIVGTSGFCVLRAEKCLQEYLLYVVLSEEFTSDMISKTTGANYPAISNNDVLDYKIKLPPIELQNKFAEFVKLIDKQKFEIQKSLEEIQKLQKSLMNEYFGG